MRTLAIGDLHGCSFHLHRLLEAIELQPDDRLIFLGDYVDRGPDSRGTLERLLRLNESNECIFLRGNHELMMSRARSNAKEHRIWMQVGGAQTLGSYGPSPGRSGLLEDVPEAHWHLMDKVCRDYFETETHIFVHAGLDPDLDLNDQTEDKLFWDFLKGPIAHFSGKTTICGHTAQKSGAIWNLGTTICLDTYAFGGGKLSALCVESSETWQIDILGRAERGSLPPRKSGLDSISA